MAEIRPLTGLRFLAALYVFIFHIDMPFRTPLTWLPTFIQNILHHGRLGVTLFFVLSGFVLVYSHLNEFASGEFKPASYWRGFMFNRLARIYPVFISGLLFMALLSTMIGLSPPPYIPLLSATFLQIYFPSIAMQWYDSGAWSVAYEICFYLLFPLALPVLIRLRSRNHLMLALIGCSAFGFGMGLLASHAPIFGLHMWKVAFSFPIIRFPEFVAGMITALLVTRHRWKVQPWLAVMLVVVTLLYLASFAHRLGGITISQDWIVVPVIAMLISATTASSDHVLFRWLGTFPMRYLGQISYSFYIAQIPLLFLLDWLVTSHRVSNSNVWVLPILLFINLIISVLMYEIIESPTHRWLIAWKKRHHYNQAVT
ncbi:acyltransferase [Hymenobacter sp. UYCo722]|uniref:acyltransferase family protein n=1 Tax=Hymenobacter sp. UYCo722 TaxID=3156335 RepID=UPI00339A1F8C